VIDMVLENFANVLAIITIFTGSMLSLAYFPQAYKIWKRKSAEDISLAMFGIIFPALVIWLLYGLSINNFPLIIANAIGVIGCGSIILLYFKYKKRGK
jgi:MtN3 and saliva related transmembrane protein